MSVQLVFKDATSFTFPTADHLASYPDSDLTAILTTANTVVGVVPTSNLEYAIIS